MQLTNFGDNSIRSKSTCMKQLIGTVLLLSTFNSYSQDIGFARKMVDTLSSATFWGRGYTKDGMKKAGLFLAEQFRNIGLEPLAMNYQQPFTYTVNTFPGKMELSINGKTMVPGKDFIVSPESRGVKTGGRLEQADSIQYINRENKVIIKVADKLTWSVAHEEVGFTIIIVDKKSMPAAISDFKVNIENEFEKSFKAFNVAGFVKGTKKPDSVIMITAHFDHLGGMGKYTYFPGANDNASGLALLLNLARYYAAHPAPYSIAFVCFAGEEAGLIGSKYYTEHPLLPLKQVRFLLNTDLAGTGEEGITVVNASEFPKEYILLNKVNDEKKLLVKINARGKAANSDHYFFTEKGVPAFFFYTLGGIKAYHDIYDKAETLPLTEHEDLFKLVVGFNEKLMGN